MCRETRGATPVKRCTWAASLIFSNGSRGVPGVLNTLKRVPEFPNAQLGSSMVCWRSAARARSRGDAKSVMRGGSTPSGCPTVTMF